MLIAALRDLQWRQRRVAITVIGTGLVFGMTLVLAGLSASFGAEADHFVNALGADTYFYSDQASGPFTGALPFAASQVDAVKATPGITGAAPLVFTQAPLQHSSFKLADLIGVSPGGIGSPKPTTGRALRGTGEVVVATKLGKHPGDAIVIAGRRFIVAGTFKSTAIAGTPNVFMPIADVQALVLGGQPLAMAILARGHPSVAVKGLAVATPAAARDNLVRPLKDARGAISFISILLWIVAGIIIGSVVYLSALERARDFAVFKATGASNGSILVGLALQAIIVALCAAAVGLVIAVVLAPTFPMDVVLSPGMYALLPAIAVVVGLLASLAAMRRVSSIDPAAAFGGP